ncbi:MAG: T9SS type A sorting domain-containing protein [Bacteroidetes bacterium]|nr:T9SS type A sorting domain-containing protein [Bacteroidota bacterium]
MDSIVFAMFIMAQPVHKKVCALFLGNSYTYVNNLPLLISNLALANKDTLVYDDNTPGGYTLNNHFTDIVTNSKINAKAWDYVIVQAQSQEPSLSPAQVYSQTLPYARKLDSLIKHNNSCSNTVFYETWGRKNGDASNCGTYPPVCTYLGMQNRLKQSYKKFADTCNAIVSPVGEAFKRSIALSPNIELYQADESHPSLEGSYLAACVFYEVLFQKSVLSNTFIASVNSATATFLQQVAHTVVTDSLAVWNLGIHQPWADFSYNWVAGLNYHFITNSQFFTNMWYFGDGGTSLVPTTFHFYPANGTYTVTHIVSDNCKTDSILKEVIINSTGLQTNTTTPVFIYPNPVHNNLFITGADNFENNNSLIEIIDQLGRRIYKAPFSKIINTRNFINGLYYLKIYNPISTLNFQFIKSD